VNVILYVEGGGESETQHTEFRKAWQKLLSKAGLTGRMPRVVSGGRRNRAFGLFRGALGKPGARHLLLVDSEHLVLKGKWDHVLHHDNWQRPDGATEEHLFLMVQCMESWLRADEEALRRRFGECVNQLPGQANGVEPIPKDRLIRALERSCRYRKGDFALLAEIDPEKVKAASIHAREFFNRLDAIL
jgi:hypothetical protein